MEAGSCQNPLEIIQVESEHQRLVHSTIKFSYRDIEYNMYSLRNIG